MERAYRMLFPFLAFFSKMVKFEALNLKEQVYTTL